MMNGSHWFNNFFMILAYQLLVLHVSSYSRNPPPSLHAKASLTDSRRAFVTNSIVPIAWSTFAHQSLAVNINVTPVAHTFITSGGSVKPLRENDATRFLTNARVVYLLEGSGANVNLTSEVVVLTDKRKAEQGPGVTPGKIHVAGSKALTDYASSLGMPTESLKDTTAESVAKVAATLPEGDTLLVGPVKSSGVAVDGKLVSDVAKALGVLVGGAKSGGVLSVLLDGPRKDVAIDEGGYPISTLLWYSF